MQISNDRLYRYARPKCKSIAKATTSGRPTDFSFEMASSGKMSARDNLQLVDIFQQKKEGLSKKEVDGKGFAAFQY